jgi:hypothetical protein
MGNQASRYEALLCAAFGPSWIKASILSLIEMAVSSQLRGSKQPVCSATARSMPADLNRSRCFLTQLRINDVEGLQSGHSCSGIALAQMHLHVNCLSDRTDGYLAIEVRLP